MAALSNYHAGALLNTSLRSGDRYIGLFLSTPGATNNGVEVAGGGYARKPITFSQPEAVNGKQQPDQNGTCRHDEHDDDRLDRALFDALCVTRAEILRRKAGHRRAETVERRHQQTVDLVCRTETVLRCARDHRAVEHIKLHDDALHHDDADCQPRKL